MWGKNTGITIIINPLNAELNTIRHLLALVVAHHFVHVSRLRVKYLLVPCSVFLLYSLPSVRYGQGFWKVISLTSDLVEDGLPE
jgi:hypothetical protein